MGTGGMGGGEAVSLSPMLAEGPGIPRKGTRRMSRRALSMGAIPCRAENLTSVWLDAEEGIVHPAVPRVQFHQRLCILLVDLTHWLRQ